MQRLRLECDIRGMFIQPMNRTRNDGEIAQETSPGATIHVPHHSQDLGQFLGVLLAPQEGFPCKAPGERLAMLLQVIV